MQNKIENKDINAIEVDITPQDIETSKLNFSDSNTVIDELAFSVGEWTENDLMEDNFDDEPIKPYNFNYENDLVENTKTLEQLKNICTKLDISIKSFDENFERENAKSTVKHAGAFLALHYPDFFQELLEAYQNDLIDNQGEGEVTSEKYSKDLQEEKEYFFKELEHEWLHGDRSNTGVIYAIGKHYSENPRLATYNQKEDIFTITLSKDDIGDLELSDRDGIKMALMDSIKNESMKQKSKQDDENKKRKEERERKNKYQAEQKEKEKKEKTRKLQSLINNGIEDIPF